ncbi:MAG: NrfD/PsrC family molybdoenzyme membrane anchor subunit [Anaerolineae bacterium]
MLPIDSKDKEKLIDPLFRTGLLYWVALGGLLAIIAWGIFMYVRQLMFGLGQTGMQRPTYWGVYMVNFIFFIGISHAGTLISAILRVTSAEWRRPITRVAEAITAFALIVGTLQIFFDMGRPERALNLFIYGRLQSPLLWDAVSVTAYFLGSVTYLYMPLIPDAAILRDHCPQSAPRWRKLLYTLLALGWRGNKTQWIRLEKAIAVLAVLIIPIAVSVHTIISWILATTVQPGWHSTIFGPYFVVGAIFSGIGALFIAMTVLRRTMGLESYIAERQYRNLGLLFIAMTAIWFYFTGAEHLTLAAGQQSAEFPVLASKLWGLFAPGFWTMVILMVIAFWVMVVPKLLPEGFARVPVLRPRLSLASGVVALIVFAMLYTPQSLPVQASLEAPNSRLIGGIALALLLVVTGLGVSMWLKKRPVTATVIAAVCVVIGMWLERWNIIVPTLTHPRLSAFWFYNPTFTEASITAASLAIFALMFLVFFKLFPAVSIWEVAEGRVIEEAQSKVQIPTPPEARPPRRHLGFR